MAKSRKHCRSIKFAMLILPALCMSLATPPIAAGQANAAPPTLPPKIDAKSQAVLTQVIQALGGADFLNFKTLTTRGRIFLFSEGDMAGAVKFISEVEYPEKRRFTYGNQKPVTLINDGDEGWEVDRLGVIRQKDEQIRNWKLAARYTLENLLRIRVHEPGVLVQDGGVDFVNNFPARVLDISDARGARVKLYVRSTTFLPLRVDYRVLNNKTGEWDEHVDDYSDYQPKQNIMTPMHITHSLDGERVTELFRNTAAYDQTYPAGHFQPPE